MGTRYEDQPAEHWAGPEALDPTPVWKQYVLLALLLFVGLIAIVVVAVAALAPQFVTPPALVPGDRLVLAASEVPPVIAPARLVSYAWLGADRELFLVQPAKGEVVAIRRRYVAASGASCAIDVDPVSSTPERMFVARCPDGAAPRFTAAGRSADGRARDADRYLVSVSGDRVIVNLSRVIEAADRTSGPVPTGIPQPQQTP